jgi:C4-dicarboxylate-specific signal transduction histidine kinase
MKMTGKDHMMGGLENVEFLDLFDVKTIQSLQDSFAHATGVASIITRPDGTPITQPSNFCRLCSDIIRKTDIGLKNCYRSHAQLREQNKEVAKYKKCFSGGLWDAGASISVGNKHIANWLIGQVKNEESDYDQILKYAIELGADETEAKAALEEVPNMPLKQFKVIADFLFAFANLLSERAYQNLQLKMYKDHLEQRVKEKTEDLEKANEELKTTNEELFEKSEIINNKNNELNATLKNLKETQAQLIQSEKMASLGTLTAGVAHELNNPLNYLMGAYVGLDKYFKEHGSKDEARTSTLINAIKSGIDRSSNIINGLNQFSRNNSKYDEECNLHSILDNCLLMLSNQTKYIAEVNKDYHDGKLTVMGNVGKLHQVFINLLVNAVHAIEENAEIIVRTRKLQEKAVIEVIDNGKGIKEENLSQITDPFFTTKPPGEGTGLGLSISYAIVKEHGGTLEFQSELNKGTTAIVKLPCKT